VITNLLEYCELQLLDYHHWLENSSGFFGDKLGLSGVAAGTGEEFSRA